MTQRCRSGNVQIVRGLLSRTEGVAGTIQSNMTAKALLLPLGTSRSQHSRAESGMSANKALAARSRSVWPSPSRSLESFLVRVGSLVKRWGTGDRSGALVSLSEESDEDMIDLNLADVIVTSSGPNCPLHCPYCPTLVSGSANTLFTHVLLNVIHYMKAWRVSTAKLRGPVFWPSVRSP